MHKPLMRDADAPDQGASQQIHPAGRGKGTVVVEASDGMIPVD